ncbi:MAG: response regulator [Actinobacteria bacterium]|nr:MAG: response regulator [Actinomycetota bacterium]
MSAIRILVAEDESIIRLDLRESLEEEGYEVVAETARGDDAVELVERLRPDVAILDIKMPGLDGIEAARRIHEGRSAAVLLLTAFSQRDLVEQARDAGAQAYLVKPFQRADLVPAVELALARHRERIALEDEVQQLEARLEARKVIDRAKGTLIDEHFMTEADAFSYIQKTAMRTRTTMQAVAEQILAGTLAP